MRELLRLSDPVQLSFIEASLTSAGIDCLILDRNVGSLYGGAIPARIMVDDADLIDAQAILNDMNIKP